MLIQFTLENWRSFKEEETFSLLASSSTEHKQHIRKLDKFKNISPLGLSAIYGANSAGKSNLLAGIKLVKNLVINGIAANDPIPVIPFLLSSKTKTDPTRFELLFIYDNVLYQYGFSADNTRIFEEWLWARSNKRLVKYYERSVDNNGQSRFSFGNSFFHLSGQSEKQRFEFVMKSTRKNQLFITEAKEKNIPEVEPVIVWFREKLQIISANSRYLPLAIRTDRDQSFNKQLCDFLELTDTGIDGISTKYTSLTEAEIPENYKKKIERDLQKVKDIAIIGGANNYTFATDAAGRPSVLKLYTQHNTENSEVAEFGFDMESDGTQRVIHLFPVFYNFKDQDNVYIVDELDRRLHPHLSKGFVNFLLQIKNPKSQFIFTTHETHLLDLNLLRRDEIWFVEKDQNQSSHLSSLIEYKIRKDLDIRKGYLNGRFSAIPLIGDLQSLGWS